jgi:hypothetical protein
MILLTDLFLKGFVSSGPSGNRGANVEERRKSEPSERTTKARSGLLQLGAPDMGVN